MSYHFNDDEPVELDCGCCCTDGSYSISSCKILNRETQELETVTLTYCYDEDECFFQAIDNKLNFRKFFSYTEGYVKSAYEKECELGDLRYDESRGN